MNSYNRLFDHNFIQEMDELEAKCSVSIERELNDLHTIFSDVDDGLFAYLFSAPFSGYPAVKSVIPGWASDEIRQDSTGEFSFLEHIIDATCFWRTVREGYQAITGNNISVAKVADYGAGWGRVTRFANKDVPARQLFAIEPNPVFRDIYSECKLPGKLIPTDWLSSETIDLHDIDLIFSYSIITHSSDSLTKNIIERWYEITKPGAVIAFTVRPGCWLGEQGGDMGVFTEAEHSLLKEQYQNGDLVYKQYEGSPDWGVTIASEAYLEKVFNGRFRLTRRSFQIQTWNQIILFAVRV